MAERKDKPERAWINFVGLTLLAICYVGALMNVFTMKKDELARDVIRITHWQLELGVRGGLDELIRRFEEKKAAEGQPVKVVQIAITEKAYRQYVTTQMIGGTAPDMIELGFFPEEFFGRYFIPLSREIQRKNPFLQERYEELQARQDLTEDEAYFLDTYKKLKDLSWMETFKDGLRTQYKEELQEYYGVGFSQFTVRMFYNKDMFKKILGRTDPPRDFSDLIDCCRRIRAYSEEQGINITPIASSKYQTDIFKYRYLTSITADLTLKNDINLDGWCAAEETVAAILRGDWSPHDEQYMAALDVINTLAQYFPRGFMSLGRMDAGFSFVQGKAAMITSGSWDARSFLKKVREQPEGQRFEVGIFDIPMIDENHPKYGKYFDGQVTEASTGTGFPFGITRFSKNKELCVEFLQFCTTPENNEVLNEYAEWIPAVRGARSTEMLKKFEPNFVGYWGGMLFHTGQRGKMVDDQIYWPLISGEIDKETYAERLLEKLPSQAALDYSRRYNEWDEGLPTRRTRRSSFLVSTVLGPEEQRETNSRKLLRAWDTLANYANGKRRMRSMMRETELEIERSNYTSPFNKTFFTSLERELDH